MHLFVYLKSLKTSALSIPDVACIQLLILRANILDISWVYSDNQIIREFGTLISFFEGLISVEIIAA